MLSGKNALASIKSEMVLVAVSMTAMLPMDLVTYAWAPSEENAMPEASSMATVLTIVAVAVSMT